MDEEIGGGNGMLMKLDFDTFEALCDVDDCGTSQDVEASSYHEAADMLKEDGWSISWCEGEYLHTCPDCVGREKEPKL